MQVVKSSHREVGDVVFRILAAAKGLLALVEDTDHGIKARLDIDFLADCGLVTKQLLPCVVPKDDNVGTLRIFIVSKHASLKKSQIRHQADLRCIALENCAG